MGPSTAASISPGEVAVPPVASESSNTNEKTIIGDSARFRSVLENYRQIGSRSSIQIQELE